MRRFLSLFVSVLLVFLGLGATAAAGQAVDPLERTDEAGAERSATFGWGPVLVAEYFQSDPRLDPEAETRDCSDLFLGSDGAIWAAAATDRGDLGPFQSVVFRLARFDKKRGVVEPEKVAPAKETWVLDGLKVEAIGGTPEAEQPQCVATDDEDLGGVWRPLPPG